MVVQLGYLLHMLQHSCTEVPVYLIMSFPPQSPGLHLKWKGGTVQDKELRKVSLWQWTFFHYILGLHLDELKFYGGAGICVKFV
jgi:hypothetical protein